VPECIAKLAKANIKIWVLTGDKQETAINIGYSCQLLTNDMDVYTIEAENEKQLQEELKEKRRLVENSLKKSEQYTNSTNIKFESTTFTNLTNNKNDQNESAAAASVGSALVINGQSLVYALSPKCELEFLELACMCKAVICCRVTPGQKKAVVDGQFRYLERLLLVHGRWSYYRISKFLRYFFYKNFASTLCHFWFAFFCGFSAQVIFT